MTARALRWLTLLEIIGFTLFVEWYIWRLQITAPHTWVIFAIWLPASFLLHRDTPRTLGWRADNLGSACRQAAIAFAFLSVALIVMALFLGAPLQIPHHLLSFHRFWSYFAFCVLQQVALNSFLNNRMLSVVPGQWRASLLSGAIFAACHWPNPVLLPLTFVGGVVMTRLFARQRNIIPLAIGQAILGTLTWWAFPLQWHHGLRVGPGYFSGWQ